MDENIKKKSLLRLYLDINVLYKILTGLILGGVLGIVLAYSGITSIHPAISMLGTIFTRLLKMIIIPMVVSSLIVGASSVSPANVGRVGLRIIVLYMVTSAVAVCFGLTMGGVFQPHVSMSEIQNVASAAGKSAQSTPVWNVISDIVPTSVMSSLVHETILQVIFFALIFGLCLSYCKVSDQERVRKAAQTTFEVFDCVCEIMMKVVGGIMQYAPIGVAVLICEVFAKNGAKVAGSLGMVVASTFLGYALFMVIIYGLLLSFYKISIKKFFAEARLPFITAFVTRSSNGTLPTTMEAAENLGVDKEVYAFALPLGATINMHGGAIYQGVCVWFLSLSAFSHSLTISEMSLVVVLATFAAIGTAGVPGAGALMLAMVMQGIGMPIAEGTAIAGAYAMILGIDAILDMGRTALNVTGDLVCTTCIAKKLGFVRKVEN